MVFYDTRNFLATGCVGNKYKSEMPSTSQVDVCASGSCTSEDAQGPLDSRKGTCVSAPKMGNLISVPQLESERSVKDDVAFSRNCQGLDGINNDVEATPSSEVCKEMKVREREHEASYDHLARQSIDSESVHEIILARTGPFETQNTETSSEKENSCVNGNLKSVYISKSKTLRSLEDEEEVIAESCDSVSCVTTTNVFQNDCNLEKNKSDVGCGAENENVEQKNEHNVNPICHEAIDGVSDKCGQDNSNVSPKVEKPMGKEEIDVMCIENKSSEKAMPFHCKYFNSCKGENNLNNEVDSERSDRSLKSVYISKSKTLRSLEDKEEVIAESCDSISCVTTTNVFQNDCNLEKNKSDVGCGAENENVEQKNEHNVNPICHEAIDGVSDKCGQDNSNISPKVEKPMRKEEIDVMCIENKSSEKAMPFHCQYFNSCKGENNLNNEVDSERSDRSIEITPESQQNITLLDLKNKKEGESVDTVVTTIEGSTGIHQSPDGSEQQIDNEPTNKEFLKNEGQEMDKINTISISANEFQSNQEQHEEDEVCTIDNTHQHSEIESKSPSSQDVNSEPFLSECDINTKMKCEGNVNKEHSGRLPLHSELSMELSPNCAKLLTKEHSGGYSSDNSSTKKSPIFQRGLFPRIAIRHSGILASKKLKKQLFVEKEKSEKIQQQERDTVCGFTNDIKLKCAQVNLVKMNSNMLSKYNVNFPSLHLGDSVGRKLKSVSLSCDGKSSVNEKNNLDHKIGHQVESAVSFEGQHKKNAKFSPEKVTDQIVARSMSASIFDSAPSSEPLVKNISNSKTNCDASSVENISNYLTGSDNTFHGGLEIKRGSKRRDPTLAFTPTKKQKQSEMKVARVNILKIDDLVLLKYGYDSQGLKINKASTAPCPPAHSPSVSSFVGNSIKTIKNHVLNPVHSNNTVSLVSMKNSAKRKMNAIKKSTTTSHHNTNSQNSRESLNIEDVPLSNRVPLNTILSAEKLTAKTKCSVGKRSGNLKTPKVLIKKIDKEYLSNEILSKMSCDLSPAKTNYKIKGSFKKTEVDGKIPHTTMKRKENASLSGRILIKRSRSTMKSINKKKNSIKDRYNLKTAQVILKNINDSPLSSNILSEYLPTKKKSSASVSKTKFHIQPTEILQKRSKKQIISQSKNCGGIDSQNEVIIKATLYKGDAHDHSKENVCLNCDLKCMKGVTVNLYKLESMFQPKILSSKHVLSS